MLTIHGSFPCLHKALLSSHCSSRIWGEWATTNAQQKPAKLVYALRSLHTKELFKRALVYLKTDEVLRTATMLDHTSPDPLHNEQTALFISTMITKLSLSPIGFSQSFKRNEEDSDSTGKIEKHLSDYILAADTVLNCAEMQTPAIYDAVKVTKKESKLFDKLLDAVNDANPISDDSRARAWDSMQTMAKLFYDKGIPLPRQVERLATVMAANTNSPSSSYASAFRRATQERSGTKAGRGTTMPTAQP